MEAGLENKTGSWGSVLKRVSGHAAAAGLYALSLFGTHAAIAPAKAHSFSLVDLLQYMDNKGNFDRYRDPVYVLADEGDALSSRTDVDHPAYRDVVIGWNDSKLYERGPGSYHVYAKAIDATKSSSPWGEFIGSAPVDTSLFVYHEDGSSGATQASGSVAPRNGNDKLRDGKYVFTVIYVSNDGAFDVIGENMTGFDYQTDLDEPVRYPSPSPSPIRTATNTPMPTNTATYTPTPSPTATNTLAPTVTPTPSPTDAPPTATPTVTPAPTLEIILLDTDTYRMQAEPGVKAYVQFGQQVYAAEMDSRVSVPVHEARGEGTAYYLKVDGNNEMAYSFLRSFQLPDAVAGKSYEVAVVDYSGLNTTPEQTRWIVFYTNTGQTAKLRGIRDDMKFYLSREDPWGDAMIPGYTQEQMNKIIDVTNLVQANRPEKIPFAPINYDDIGYLPDPITEDTGKIIIFPDYNSMVGESDFDRDGNVDSVIITIRPSYFMEDIRGSVVEEMTSALGVFSSFTDDGSVHRKDTIQLKGTTIGYESDTDDTIKPVDQKIINLTYGVGKKIGLFYPKMPMDDVFKIPGN